MKRPLRTCAILCALAALPFVGFAADHGDAPSASELNEPTADITDVYAWISPTTADKLNLVMAVNPDADEGDQFSNEVIYAFNIASKDGGADDDSTLVICQFPDDNIVECWAGNQYVRGDASADAGITSAAGGLRVFAGVRNDPFFLDYTAFGGTVTAARGEVAAGRVTFDDFGCPELSDEQQAALLGTLNAGDDAADTFAGQNVLALVVQMDSSLVPGDGDILAVWGSTHVK